MGEQPEENEDGWGQRTVRGHGRIPGLWVSQHVAALRSVSVWSGKNERRHVKILSPVLKGTI